ncbi:hypothetical protein MMC25_003056 [Agyrium rufum]|nr:hypothetical protein [Agyrium rufum]
MASFLALEGLHVFISGAAGGIGSQAVTEFLNQGCKVTAHDLRPIPLRPLSNNSNHANLFTIQGDISSEPSIKAGIAQARAHHGRPINILIANAGITDESNEYPIWKMPTELWQKTYDVNVKGTFLTIKHFLLAAEEAQGELGRELENLAIVVTGSETGKFGQAGHTEYASGKAGLQYGLVRGVKNEIVRLNAKARINAVAPGWVDTALIGDRLDDPHELWTEAQATVALRKIAQPSDVACAMAFLASHRAAGHISGEVIDVNGGMEGRIIWQEKEVSRSSANSDAQPGIVTSSDGVPTSLKPTTNLRPIKVALSIDVDAISGWLGTGQHPDNNLSDYSQGIFSGKVGVPRLVKLFKKLGIAKQITWFIPGHSMETFPSEVQRIIEAGSEIALHGYSHEGAPQLSEEQQREVLAKCISLAEKLTGKKPRGWRAPLYQIKESTLALLEENGFTYDSSLCHHDSIPFWAPKNAPIVPPNFQQPASQWMHPTELSKQSDKLVEIPCNWYMEDATPLSYYPHTANSHGYVDVRHIEQIWKDRFLWLWNNERERVAGEPDFVVYPLVLHPDTSGMAHVIEMIARHVRWLQGFGDEVQFERYEDIAIAFRECMGKGLGISAGM